MTTPPIIEGYEIIAKIADGGMSTVWKAKQLSLDRLVALKVLHEDLVKANRDVERFKTEAKYAATLRHSGLCEIYDAGETPDGSMYYAMEYVAGFSIHQLLSRKGDVPEKQALLIAHGVAQVLKAIWEKNHLVHCDIKPDNILIDQDGTIRVTDLGLSRIISQLAANTDEGYVVGTPNYMSPEQAKGNDDLDFRTDVYALGATLYQMVTGIMPFANVEEQVAAERQIDDYIADPQMLNADLSHAVVALIEKMMIKDRAARYHSWSEVIQDIEEVRAQRLPRGGLVPAGQSTVSRSAERESATQKLIDEMRPKTARPATQPGSSQGHEAVTGSGPSNSPRRSMGKRPARGPRNRRPATTGTTGKIPRSASRPPPSSDGPTRLDTAADETGAALAQKFFILLVLVGITYFASFRYLERRLASDSVQHDVPPPPSPAVVEEAEEPIVRRPQPRTETAPQPERTVTPRPAPRERPQVVRQPDREQRPAPTATASWDHPDYLEALELIAQGRQRLQQFEQQNDSSLLDPIERDTRRAIGTLNRLRPDAPPEAEIQNHVQQAFQLINNTREARLLHQ